MQIFYTTTFRIRALLGIDERELPDKVIEDAPAQLEAKAELDKVVENHAALSQAALAASPTATEVRIGEMLTLFSTYFVAAKLAKHLPLLAAKSITDGKNAFERFSPQDFDKLAEELMAQAMAYRDALVALVNPTTSETQALPPVFLGVGSSYDPVTAFRT